MTVGTIIDLLDSDSLNPVIVSEGESWSFTGTFTDENGSAISKAALLTATATLYDESTGTTINSRNDQNIIDTNGGTITSAGALTLRLDAADNVIVNSSVAVDGDEEPHVLRLKWTWNDGTTNRTGIEEYRFLVKKLNTVS